ncbi:MULTISPECIES: hypothetical protein [unclassified Streptomyces]|uniref:hypothetical protein n=1 Tax=unclassified Streptomyces TaxID=2593676 RepID=UPI00380A4D4D
MIESQVLAADDWPRWRELRLVALAEAPYAFGARLADWQGDADREERWRGRLSIPGSYNLLAALDGNPVGMASGVPGPGEGVVESGGRGEHILVKRLQPRTERGACSVPAPDSWRLYGGELMTRLVQ